MNYYRTKKASDYRKNEDPLNTSFVTQTPGETTQKRKAFQTFSRPENIKKFITYALAKKPGGPGARLYDILMRKFFKEEFGTDVEDLVTKWSTRCWNCSAEEGADKRCAQCRLAKYCSKECQTEDWKKCHKLQHKS